MLANYKGNLGTLLGMFFFWGFVAASNSVLIGFVKNYFSLSQEKAQMLDTVFYGAYFYGALSIYLFSYYRHRDLIYYWGYKRALIIGLFVSLLGMLALFIIISVTNLSFQAILIPFFIIAIGFSLQQLVANPLLLLLGNPQKSAYRLSMAGGLNSLGTLIGPLILSEFIFKYSIKDSLAIEQLGYLYLILSGIFLILIFAISFLKFPPELQAHRNSPIDQRYSYSKLLKNLVLIMAILVPLILMADHILSYLLLSSLVFYSVLFLIFPLLILFSFWWANLYKMIPWGGFKDVSVPLGMLAIFCYVGVEVSIPSNFNIFFTKENWHDLYSESWNFVEISKSAIVWYWGSLMIGRWIGVAEILQIRSYWLRYLSYILMVTLGFFTLYFCYQLSFAHSIEQGYLFAPYWSYLLLIWILASFIFVVRKNLAKLLFILTIGSLAFLLIGIFASGIWSYYSLVAVGFCLAMMWPVIFDLVLKGKLAQDIAQVSGFMIMMILGGALLSPLQGVVADILYSSQRSHWSYLVPAVALGYLLIFAIYCLRKSC